ncbi:hypothetical protein [Mycobacterium sp. M26]|uniref:hypothetical protein n=1 Tax=Mycobacterium sp. M26 TaxID=1762962 RepID=UPI0012E3C12B|nr:hypothetical protein [Mycobacterium sp. M26]
MNELSVPTQGRLGKVGSNGTADTEYAVGVAAAGSGVVSLSAGAAVSVDVAAAGDTVMVLDTDAGRAARPVVARLAAEGAEVGCEFAARVCGRGLPVEPELAFGALAAPPLAWDLAPAVACCDDESSSGAALATPVAPASDAQKPTVRAPAPSQVETSLCCSGTRWRARLRCALAFPLAARCFAVTARFRSPVTPGVKC